jgi:hypothetical protein
MPWKLSILGLAALLALAAGLGAAASSTSPTARPASAGASRRTHSPTSEGQLDRSLCAVDVVAELIDNLTGRTATYVLPVAPET